MFHIQALLGFLVGDLVATVSVGAIPLFPAGAFGKEKTFALRTMSFERGMGGPVCVVEGKHQLRVGEFFVQMGDLGNVFE